LLGEGTAPYNPVTMLYQQSPQAEPTGTYDSENHIQWSGSQMQGQVEGVDCPQSDAGEEHCNRDFEPEMALDIKEHCSAPFFRPNFRHVGQQLA
jgi:hypothetical protein